MRKRRLSSSDDTGYGDMKSSVSDQSTDQSRLEAHHAIHPASLQMMEEPLAKPVPITRTSKEAGNGAKRTSRITIHSQVRRLHEMMGRIEAVDEYDEAEAQAWSSLQKRPRNMPDELQRSHKESPPRFLQETQSVKLGAEARIERHRTHFKSTSGTQLAGGGDEDNDVSTLMSTSSRMLDSNAVPYEPWEDYPRKRCRLSSTDSRGDADQHTGGQMSYVRTTSASTYASTRNTSARARSDASKEINDFLSDLSERIYESVITNLCPDNMRGSFCRNPDHCLSSKRFFACPLRHSEEVFA